MSLSRKMDKNVLILVSGGLDSTACLAYYLSKRDVSINCLFIDFGQLAKEQEFRAANNICNFYKIPFNKITISGMGEFSDGLINGRNALLLLIALTTFKHSFGLISIGIHSGTNYVDCNPSFVNQLQNLFDLYYDGRLIIDTPFLNWSKPEIWNFCKKSEVPIHLTYSCERGVSPACGECLSCKDIEALTNKK